MMPASQRPSTVVATLSRHPVAVDFGVFLLVGIAIVTAAWSSIGVANVEIGDFAANGLLIQKAKHFALLQGNYSRIGVHHPGPAILYVLAFGELLFNDVLHLTKSALSGQLIAACFYTAAWIVVIHRELRKLSGSWSVGLFLTAVFTAVIALFNYNFFADIWFPNLYVFPYAVLTLTMARLASGRADSLYAIAISTGFLINGHVSFVSTIGIVLVIATIVNAIVYRRVPERRILGPVFLRTHAKAIAGGLVILALFFVPLAIETIIAFPGPIPGYVHFSGDRIVHPLRESLFYVADFWGGLAPAAGALFTAVLVVTASRDLRVGRDGVVALVVVLAASTAALFIYARYGIDYLALNYLGYYYYTTPALLFVLVTFVAWQTSGTSRRRGLLVLLAAAFLFLTYWKIHRPVRDVDQYDQPGVTKLYDAIKGAAAGGRIVLDLDNRQDWGWLWTNLVGAEVIADRRHENLFCINKNWHILFTDAAQCTADEVHAHPRFTVRVIRGPRPEPVAFEALDIVFSPYRLPDITDAGFQSVLTKANTFNDYFLASGWSPPEGEHVWSDGRESHVTFRVRPGFSGTVVLTCGAFIVPEHKTVTGAMSVNGGPVSRFEFTPEQSKQTLALPIHADETGNVDIKVVVDNPTSPKATHVGDDPRVLGISLFGLEVKPQ